MSEFPILSATRNKTYNSEKYGRAKVTVEVEDFFPCSDSWEYNPPQMYEGVLGEEREMPARFRGKDITWCTVSLNGEFSETKEKRFISLLRGVRRYSFSDNDVAYETSCIMRESKKVYIKPDKDQNVQDPYGGGHEMMWKLAGPDPITLEDNLDRLIENAERLFEPRLSIRI